MSGDDPDIDLSPKYDSSKNSHLYHHHHHHDNHDDYQKQGYNNNNPTTVVLMDEDNVTQNHHNNNKNNNIPVAFASAVVEEEDPQQVTIFPKDNTLHPHVIDTLHEQQGFPIGLAHELGNTKATYPIRFWVVDNSGSMRNSDGKQLRSTAHHELMMVTPCNRWKELQGAVQYHIELAGLLEATTYFRLLNDPGPTIGSQEFAVAEHPKMITTTMTTTNTNTNTNNTNSIDHEMTIAQRIMENTEPNGVTPLTRHIQEIHQRIQAVEHVLKRQGQRAVVVLATDGIPSDDYGQSPEHVKAEFVRALEQLQSLPVWIVIRLCTDDDDVVEYYNNLDAKLELPLEVIDDFFSEAHEIQAAGNKWLNYALPLHRCREMGYQNRIMDLLDERLLNKDELLEFLKLLFGPQPFQNAPDMYADWKGFTRVLQYVVEMERKVWCPNTKRMEYWINMKQLNKCYGGSSSNSGGGGGGILRLFRRKRKS